jgi:hypothetical protein
MHAHRCINVDVMHMPGAIHCGRCRARAIAIAAERQRTAFVKIDRRAAPGKATGDPYQHERDQEERHAVVHVEPCEPEQDRGGDRYEHGVEEEIDNRRQPFEDCDDGFRSKACRQLNRGDHRVQGGAVDKSVDALQQAERLHVALEERQYLADSVERSGLDRGHLSLDGALRAFAYFQRPIPASPERRRTAGPPCALSVRPES